MKTPYRYRAVVALVVCAVVVPGCQKAPEDVAADTAEFKATTQAVLDAYLPAMATAYASGNLEPLREWAVEKELAALERRLTIMNEQGLSLHPTLVDVVVEDAQPWNRINAFVTTVETWDLRFMTSGGGSLVSERLGERQRVKYQFKNEGGRWWILYREVGETLE